MEKITEYLVQSTINTSEVKAWEEIVMLPTYGIGKEEKILFFWRNVSIRVVLVQFILIR